MYFKAIILDFISICSFGEEFSFSANHGNIAPQLGNRITNTIAFSPPSGVYTGLPHFWKLHITTLCF